jgi:hypothetical protein
MSKACSCPLGKRLKLFEKASCQTIKTAQAFNGFLDENYATQHDLSPRI